MPQYFLPAPSCAAARPVPDRSTATAHSSRTSSSSPHCFGRADRSSAAASASSGTPCHCDSTPLPPPVLWLPQFGRRSRVRLRRSPRVQPFVFLQHPPAGFCLARSSPSLALARVQGSQQHRPLLRRQGVFATLNLRCAPCFQSRRPQ